MKWRVTYFLVSGEMTAHDFASEQVALIFANDLRTIGIERPLPDAGVEYVPAAQIARITVTPVQVPQRVARGEVIGKN
jgi:hypothetical protein